MLPADLGSTLPTDFLPLFKKNKVTDGKFFWKPDNHRHHLRFLLERATDTASVPPIIHVVPKIACEKPSTVATAVFFSGRRHSLLAVVGLVAQPRSSTPGMCILHLVTHLLKVYPNPNSRNPYLLQQLSLQPLPPTAGAGAWKNIT
ncbi:hypothetical protein PIB30_053815 [Stylosanthes scabra]|uniref:Uncharacterized protein n=1 Tax=Stylosanthes scabra TaxID=79078 RepID=A0ABU6QJC1_9FABA|nr:hypothetical protein [Stylosanthes scabra]